MYHHDFINHASSESVQGDVTTDTIEGFWKVIAKHMAGLEALTDGAESREAFQIFFEKSIISDFPI